MQSVDPLQILLVEDQPADVRVASIEQFWLTFVPLPEHARGR